LKFAIWGCGSIGQRHLRNVIGLGHTDVVVFDPSPERRTAMASDFDVQVVDSADQLLGTGVDITIVASPTIFHRDQVRQLLDATDSHVFVEKPLSHTSEGLSDLLAVAGRKRTKVMVACNWRFYPAIRKVRELLSDGAIGRPLSARIEGGSYLPGWHPWEDYRQGYSARKDLGGGCLLDCIHEIDYSNWLFGDPREVVGLYGTMGGLEIDTEDVAALLIRYSSGTIVTVHLDYVQRPAHRSCRVIGSEGTIEWSLEDSRVRWFDPNAGDWTEWPVTDPNAVDASYVDEIAHFIDAVQQDDDNMSGLDEGLRAVNVVEAARASQTNGRIVTL
jgi:predicted dehydrogenase